MHFAFRCVKFLLFHLSLKIMLRLKRAFSFGWKSNFPLKNNCLRRISKPVYSASSPIKNEISKSSAKLSRAISTAVLMNYTPWNSCFTSRLYLKTLASSVLNVLCAPHNIKGLCPFSSSKINSVSQSLVGLPPFFVNGKNRRYPCDKSNGHPAVVAMAISAQNAPSSDRRGAALGPGGT